MNMKRYRLKMTTFGIMICFFLFGYCDAVRGATLTDVTSTFQVGYAVGGTLMVVHYIGYCASSLLFGSLTGKIHRKSALIIANVNIAVGIGIYITAGRLLVFSVSVLMIGFSLGLYEYAGNTAVADIYPEQKRGKFTNIVAGMHGIGAVLGPMVFGTIVKQDGNFQTAFMVILPVILCVIIIFAFTTYPDENYLSDEPLVLRDIFRAMLDKKARKYYILATLYIAAEAGITTWITAYFVDERGFELDKAALMLSLFFIFLTFGRFVGSTYVDKLGYRRVFLFHFLAAGVCIVAGAILPGNAAILLSISGVFLSVIFPSLGAGLSVECSENTAVIMGAFFAFAALGGAFGSWGIGLLSQLGGAQMGIGCTAVFCFISVIIVWFTMGNKEVGVRAK